MVKAAATGMGQGLFVDDSTSDAQWLPQTLPAGTKFILHYYSRWYWSHHDRRLDYPLGESNDDYVMAETVGLLDAGQIESLTKRINHAEDPTANAKLLGGRGGDTYPEIETLRDIEPGEELLMNYGNHLGAESPLPSSLPTRPKPIFGPLICFT